MSQAVVIDSSVLVAVLLDGGKDGTWATRTIGGSPLRAPALVDFETANVIRRHETAGDISADQAAQAHLDLQELTIERWPYDLLANRSWQLRHNLSIYDASYVALAELVDTALVTLDERLSRAPGLRCNVLTPD